MLKFAFSLLIPMFAIGFENREAKEDVAAIQLEGYFGFPDPAPPFSADAPFARFYGYTFLPLTKIAGRDLVASVEISAMNREFRQDRESLNYFLLQGYSLGLGFDLVKSGAHSGFIYFRGGIAGDWGSLSKKALNADLSYSHVYQWSNNLSFGLGADLAMFLNDYTYYPVFLLDWRITPSTKVGINFDTMELKQYLSKRVAVAVGAQYDFFAYGLANDGEYFFETVSGMTYLEYLVAGPIFFRIWSKVPVWGAGRLVSPTGIESRDPADGFSIRSQFAYGI